MKPIILHFTGQLAVRRRRNEIGFNNKPAFSSLAQWPIDVSFPLSYWPLTLLFYWWSRIISCAWRLHPGTKKARKGNVGTSVELRLVHQDIEFKDVSSKFQDNISRELDNHNRLWNVINQPATDNPAVSSKDDSFLLTAGLFVTSVKAGAAVVFRTIG